MVSSSSCGNKFPVIKLELLSDFHQFYFSNYIGQAVIIAVASNNQPLATDEQANHYHMQVSQQEWKPPQTEYTCENLSMLTLCLLFYA